MNHTGFVVGILKPLLAAIRPHRLEKRLYSERPRRFEYVLTERGRDFRQVNQALLAWGNRHFAPEGASVVILDRETGEIADPVMVDRHSGRPLSDPVFASAAGPAADARTQARFAGTIGVRS